VKKKFVPKIRRAREPSPDPAKCRARVAMTTDPIMGLNF
jgi:hypothetical protein